MSPDSHSRLYVSRVAYSLANHRKTQRSSSAKQFSGFFSPSLPLIVTNNMSLKVYTRPAVYAKKTGKKTHLPCNIDKERKADEGIFDSCSIPTILYN